MKATVSLIRQIHAIWQTKGLVSNLLLPLSWLTRLIVIYRQTRHRRHAGHAKQSSHPIMVVGNLVVGGTGKTPVVIAVVQAMQARGWTPGVISRGYGARPGDEAKAGQGDLDPGDFGDEPAVIAKITQVPLAVHPRRVLALQKLQAEYPQVDLIIADDGLQHWALDRDVELVVQDARGVGNGRLLPAGPLRELAGKLTHVDFLITNLSSSEPPPEPLAICARQVVMRLHPDQVRHLASNLTLDWAAWHTRYANAPVSAVAAIGQPERFFSMLGACGVTLDAAIALPDHYSFKQSPFTSIKSEVILITAKDAVKCSHFNDPRLWVVSAAPQFSDMAWLDELHDTLAIIARKKKA